MLPSPLLFRSPRSCSGLRRGHVRFPVLWGMPQPDCNSRANKIATLIDHHWDSVTTLKGRSAMALVRPLLLSLSLTWALTASAFVALFMWRSAVDRRRRPVACVPGDAALRSREVVVRAERVIVDMAWRLRESGEISPELADEIIDGLPRRSGHAQRRS